MEAGKRQIGDIFAKTRHLEIPFFQRAYVWGRENWDRLLEDMLEVAQNEKDYFLGSVILKQRLTDSGQKTGDVRIVVDGQQRLTTLMLLFHVLCQGPKQRGIFRNTFYTYEEALILRHNHNDIEVFEAILHEDLSDTVRAKHEGNKVLAAFDYFVDKRTDFSHIDPVLLLKRVYFVGIDLGPDEDEQQIFDTINSLGVSLTTAELLKNHLFSRADIALFNATWREVFERDEATKSYWEKPLTSGRSRRQSIDVLLQAFLIFRSEADEKYARVDQLFNSYKDYLAASKVERREFVASLKAWGESFRATIDVEISGRAVDPADAVERLNVLFWGLNMTTAIPYFLYVQNAVSDAGDRDRIYRLLETFVMRRLVCGRTTKNYNNLFASFVKHKVCNYASLRDRLMSSTDATTDMPSDDEVAVGFRDSRLTNQQSRLILYLLEASTRDATKHSTALLGLRGYSLEHLMPKKWRNHWSHDLDEEEQRRRDRKLLTLGNLALLTASLNSAIRDADWPTKKAGKGRRAGLLRYTSNMETLFDDLERETWDEEAISERGERLAQAALATWALPV